MTVYTAGLLVIQNRKLLLAFSNNKQCFYLPGGKINDGETAVQALCREIAEELNTVLVQTVLQFYTQISAPAYGERAGTIMEQQCFFVTIPVTPVAAAEIGALQYFTLEEYRQQENTAPGAVMILQQLKNDGYID
jgi:8-oxo-dGTP pyrophosphatase MutT (NUDIX family)